MPYTNTDTTVRRRTIAAAAALAAVATVAAPAARAALTFVNTYDTSAGGTITDDQKAAIGYAEAAYSNAITSDLTVTMSFASTTASLGTGPTGLPATTAYFAPANYYATASILTAYLANATTPLRAAAAGPLAAGL